MNIPICQNCHIKGVALYSHPHGTSKSEGYFCPSCKKYLQQPSIRYQESDIYIGDVRDFLQDYRGQKFDLILIDPPWRYQVDLVPKSRKTENHYNTLTIDNIASLPILNIATEPSVIFLWATNSLLPEAIRVMEQWGFRFVTKIEWVKKSHGKLQKGMGYNIMGSSESILIGKHGNYPVPEWRPPSVLEAPRTRHSEKPELSYLTIERMYPRSRKLEIFARKPRRGWYSVGDQLETMHSFGVKSPEVCIEGGDQ